MGLLNKKKQQKPSLIGGRELSKDWDDPKGDNVYIPFYKDGKKVKASDGPEAKAFLEKISKTMHEKGSKSEKSFRAQTGLTSAAHGKKMKYKEGGYARYKKMMGLD